jgi:5'-nucleotidase
MRLLCTNDDGIDAPGLQALLEAVGSLGEPIVVAPLEHVSGCSHRVTTSQPLRLHSHREPHLAIDGTPADCVRVGLHLDAAVDWVLSGINEGGNLGADVHISGTVAAVREAVLHGKPGVALSHYHRRGRPIDWATAAAWGRAVLEELLARPWTPGTFWNVNLPHLEPGAARPDVVFCPLEPGPLPLSFRREGDLLHYNGDYHQRPRRRGSDVDVCFGGNIAVTELRLF